MAPLDPPFALRTPSAEALPLVVDSPHSGMVWPPGWAPVAPRAAILTTWDAFVDELWSDAPAAGASLLTASFPRAFIDANRAESDIDPQLLGGAWPAPLAPTAYSERGMGLIRRDALPGVPMYDAPLSVTELEMRLRDYYRPYRAVLRSALDAAHARHGGVWHLNCHSMKSRGNAMNVDAGSTRPDVVVSDGRGASADPVLTGWAAEWFRHEGLSAQVNDPYTGGDLVRTFGAPGQGRHSVQIELNRALYLDEAAFARGPRFGEVRALCARFVQALSARVRAEIRP